ncbi:gastrula zinc finger protein XlCGF48.2 isoform X3 [Ceratitis capitata]|uniref:gastrula zinc finger protein XlCGF48.2 isoform X3 n=1 Tax=Ceratitis capitata TaxID=7213 RepID=UPI0006188252|nr:gastrula zinc finger protein XlCGF48.2 isoform X3 [Ceratitis capitata]
MQTDEGDISSSLMTTEYVDLSDYCRLCLQLPDETQVLNLELIYDEEEQLTYYDCFVICTQIDLRADGINKPQQLCKSCGLELQVAYDFHKKVEESKKFLMQIDKTQNLKEQALETKLGAEEIPLEQEIVEGVPQSTTEKIDNDIATAEGDATEHLDVPVDYEELEEHIDIEEYQSVEELADEDAETVQIRINDDHYVVKKVNLNNGSNPEVLDVQVHQTSQPEIYMNSRRSFLSDDVSDILTIECERVEDKSEKINLEAETTSIIPIDNPPNVAKVDIAPVVINKEGILKSRRRYMGKFSCQYCQKVFKNRSRMITHRRSHEPDRPKFECEECGRLYATKQAKDVHIRTYHNRSGLKCSVCDKVFVIKKLLEVHMRFHTGDFPYVCDICGQKFAQMCHLNTHKNVKHNSVRYSCEHPGCGKYFTSSASLRNHEFSHSMMPFECSYCKRGYPAKAKLKVHIRQKHGIEVSLEQMEDMRKFHVMRSKLNLIKIS